MNVIVNHHTVCAAVKAFDPYKSPGFDGIYPAMLQKGITILSPFLIKIFKTSLRLGCLAESWLQVKTVFIPKPGKTDYNVAKSFRPISLMSFMLKTLERLIYWHLQTEHWHNIPINDRVYSYREGISTETALHDVTQIIERALNKKQMVLAIYLDISGAFSNTAVHSMINALEKRGVAAEIIKWADHFLTNRTARAKIGSTEIERKINNGCPEGGINSPHLFNCVVSEGVDLFNDDPGLECFAYADDLKILKVGKNLEEMAQHLQLGINKLMTWACCNNLRFNAEKTKAMIFSRRRETIDKPNLTVDGKIIEYVDTFKYLGVTFDSKLLWTTHVLGQIKKAQASLMTCRNSVGRYWGLNPKVTKWIYTAIVRPQLTYGSIVWVSALAKKHLCKKLNSLQRMACKMITSGIHSTPTMGMEILVGLLPLVDFIELAATNCSVRLARTGHWNLSPDEALTKSHVGLIETVRSEIPEILYPMDKTPFKVRVESKFETTIGDKIELTIVKIRPMPYDLDTINCFTDGSKSESGTGAAYIIKGHQIKIQDFIHLGQLATIFQAEIFAISMASLVLLDKNIMGKKINFYVDSQSAIKALQSYFVFTKSVLECKNLVNKLAETNTVYINWIPGHVGQLGNEIADRLAKMGAQQQSDGAEPRVATAPCIIKTATCKWFKDRHNQNWQRRMDCRQSKLVLPNTEHKWEKCTKYLDRNGMRILTQVATGHSSLNRHKFIMGMVDSPNCELCGMVQTPIHIITECPTLAGQRIHIFGCPTLPVEAMKEFNPGKIIRFAIMTELWKG